MIAVTSLNLLYLIWTIKWIHLKWERSQFYERMNVIESRLLPMYWQCLQWRLRDASTGSSMISSRIWKGGWRWSSSWNDQLGISQYELLSKWPNSRRALTFSRKGPTNSIGYPGSPKLLNLKTLNPLFLFLWPIRSRCDIFDTNKSNL